MCFEPREPCRVLIVDDHPAVRSALRRAITAHPDARVVGEASDGDAAIHQAQRLRPAVVVMDIDMPSISGVEAARSICSDNAETRILLLTAHTNHKAAIAGASGLLFKGEPATAVVRAVLALGRGESGPGEREMGDARVALQGERNPSDTAQLIRQLVVSGARDRSIVEQLGVERSAVSNVVRGMLVEHGIARPTVKRQ